MGTPNSCGADTWGHCGLHYIYYQANNTMCLAATDASGAVITDEDGAPLGLCDCSSSRRHLVQEHGSSGRNGGHWNVNSRVSDHHPEAFRNMLRARK